MKRLIEQWEALCASSPIPRFVDINLRGVAQVMLQDNPLTGLLFLAAIAWGSFAARAGGPGRRSARLGYVDAG